MSQTGIQGTPPFNFTTTGDGAAVRLRCGVVLMVVTSTGLRSTGGSLSQRLGSSVLVCRPFRGFRSPLGGHHGLVRSRRLEHRVEHTQQLPGHRHDGALLTAPLLQPGEQRGPFHVATNQSPGRFHQRPPQQSRAFLGDLQVLGSLLSALPHCGHQPRVGRRRLWRCGSG